MKLSVFYDIADGGSMGIYFSNGLEIELGDRWYNVKVSLKLRVLSIFQVYFLPFLYIVINTSQKRDRRLRYLG